MQQPNRQIFFREKGLFRKQKYIALDLNKTTVRYQDEHYFFEHPYKSLHQIIFHESSLQIEFVKDPNYNRKTIKVRNGAPVQYANRVYTLDCLTLCGDPWEHYKAIEAHLLQFATPHTEILYEPI